MSKGIHDHRTHTARARDRANLAQARRNLSALLRDLPAALGYAGRTAAGAAALNALTGTVGVVGYSFYEDYEDQLRPMEIDAGAQRPQLNCIFPSTQTIASGNYALSQPMLLTVAQSNLQRPAVRGFLAWYLRHAASYNTSSAFVPLPTQTLALQEAWLSGKVPAPVVTSPATGTSADPTATAADPPAQGTLVPAPGAGGVHAPSTKTRAGGGPNTTADGQAVPQTSAPLISGQG